jgi:4-hydroxybenzoate polyprenyltransferase
MHSWVIFYDTIYACQDRQDDIVAGVKSTAIVMGKNIQQYLMWLSGIFVACLTIAGVANAQGACYFILTVGGAANHLFWQLYSVDLENPHDCGETFLVRAQRHLGK